jgi:hypothetical protein
LSGGITIFDIINTAVDVFFAAAAMLAASDALLQRL